MLWKLSLEFNGIELIPPFTKGTLGEISRRLFSHCRVENASANPPAFPL